MASMPGKTKQYLILVIVLNVAVISLWAFLFLKVKASNERISTLTNEIELRVRQERTLQSVKDLVEATAEARALLNASFLKEDGAAGFLEFLESVGKGVGVVVTIKSVDEPVPSDPKALRELRVQLNADGRWKNVMQFLGVVEHLPYETRVEQVVLSRKDPIGWRVDITLTALKLQSSHESD
jgi:hypothetical protein